MVHALACFSYRSDFRQVRWYPPTYGYIKVNVYGSSFGNLSNAGFSGLLRYVNGIWIHSFSCSCGRASNLFAELLAI